MAEEELPFARKVKEELSGNSYTKEEKKYLLSGFVRNGAVFSLGRIPTLKLQTESARTARLLYESLKEVYGLSPSIVYENVARFGRGLVYVVMVKDSRLYDVMVDLEIFDPSGLVRVVPKEALHRKNLRPFVVGCFLSNGSLNNPSTAKTSYFLEMAFTEKSDALAVKRKLDTFRNERTMAFKAIRRRDKTVLYLKRSDQISSFLAYLGATENMLEFENMRVEKDDANTTNRLSICDSANYSRTIETSAKDRAAIELVLKAHPIGTFDPKTQAVIRERTEHPEENYRELAEILQQKDGIAITKSGVVHVIQSLRAMAEEEKKKSEK